jgi:hypothetical protein
MAKKSSDVISKRGRTYKLSEMATRIGAVETLRQKVVANRAALTETVSEPSVVKRERRISQCLVRTGFEALGPAPSLAGLFIGEQPEALVAKAMARFRCISWDVLKLKPEVITGGGSLDGKRASFSLQKLTEPCRLGDCDAFLSHSWHDDGKLKWNALKSWCENFESTHQRPPLLWLDKVCIDQNDVHEDLKCLPIFVAGCNKMLVLTGQTYTNRLWCCVELFIYMTMFAKDETRELPEIITLGADECEHEVARGKWRDFDANACECFDPKDKARIFSRIGCLPGGVTAFNKQVKTVVDQLFGP